LCDVPRYVLDSGPDLGRIPELIRELLDRHGR
jgi:hypothetical protein